VLDRVPIREIASIVERIRSPLTLQADSPPAARDEAGFYGRYDWCLNPILSLQQLFRRLNEELDAAPTLRAPWQRAESRINLYLYTCAIACTVDDYLCRSLADLSPIATHFPRLRWAVKVAERLLVGGQALRGAVVDRSVARWRRQWARGLDAACDLLVSEAEPGDRAWNELAADLRPLTRKRLRVRLLRRRMSLPAAFRNQDLTHHDVAALARRVAASGGGGTPTQPRVVVGVRTAGAYFAPLLKAYLGHGGGAAVSWMTIRPKQVLSPRERRQVRRLARSGAQVVIVDEPPNSGDTFRRTLAILARAGVSADRVTVAAPRSPANVDWTLPGIRLVTLDPADYHKARLLDPAAIAPLLREYCGANARIPENAKVEALNIHLRAHHRDGFHVRLKRVFEVRDIHPHSRPTSTYVIAKGVGWGWLSYHAYIAGTRLAGRVPRVIGLRHGLLFTEWVGELAAEDVRPAPDVPVDTIASYVAARTQRLRLAEDPCLENPAYGRSGWSELVHLLKRPYGLYIGRAKIPTLRQRMKQLVSPVPTLIDGRIRPEEWVATAAGTFKTDFEHHSFGKTELNVVDPAYDLAGATFAFGLSPERERQLMQRYVRETGDGNVVDRVLPYKLLIGVMVMEDALHRASQDVGAARHEWNARYLAARSWLTSQLSRFAASCIPAPAAVTWSKRLFCLDLDGVFNAEALGFTHTSTSGLAALALLRAHGFSVIVHTGRSVEDVRSYCRDYALPGGVAELGSVFVDAVAHREVPLVDDQATEQLPRCRAALARLPDIFVDPAYHYAVRAYRITHDRTVPPPRGQVEGVLQEAGLDRLVVSPSPVDVIVLARGVDKGRGLTAARDYLGCANQPVAAIGDSDRDVPMLAAADVAFAPSGCSAAVRALSNQGRCRIIAAPMQRGLLRAARELVGSLGTRAVDLPAVAPPSSAPAAHLIATLLDVVERSRLRQVFGALAWWRL